MKIDVIIPTYKPGKEFEKLIGRLQKQEYPIHKIIIINTRTDIFPEELNRSNYKIEITHIEPDQFDHGGTRNMGAGMSDADIVVYMTQDAIPVDEKLIGTFAKIFEENPDIWKTIAKRRV